MFSCFRLFHLTVKMVALSARLLLQQTIVDMIMVLLIGLPTIVVKGTRVVEEVRLVRGGRWEEGRVEVRMGEEWGTVCDDEWDHQDAKVVCRMLRHTGGVAFSNAFFGQGKGNILLDSVSCSGDEENLNLCMVGLPDVTSASACTHAEDAGVRCGVEPPASGPALSIKSVAVSPLSGNCADGDGESNVRLVGSGKFPSSGLVQVRNPERGIPDFGFVCDDSWSLLNARVVCSQLCFDPEDALPGWHQPRTLQLPSSPRIVLDDVRCLGSEASLLLCRHRPWNLHDCAPSELAAVTCASVAASPRVPRAEVECLEDRMVITFQRRLNPTLKEDSLVPAQGGARTCRADVWADNVSIRVSLNYRLCATLMQTGGVNGNLSFVSTLMVSVLADTLTRNGLKRVTQYKINAQCHVGGLYSASRRLPHVGQPVLPASGDTRLVVTMTMFQDDTFTTPVRGADVVLAPAGWINLGLTLNTNQRIRLVVTSCYAGPDLEDPTMPKQALFLNKCVQEDTVSTYTINDTFWGIRFQPFSFNNFSDVTIQCDAYACRTDDASCDRSCNSATNKHNVLTTGTKRGRRHFPQPLPRDRRAHSVTVPPDLPSELTHVDGDSPDAKNDDHAQRIVDAKDAEHSHRIHSPKSGESSQTNNAEYPHTRLVLSSEEEEVKSSETKKTSLSEKQDQAFLNEDRFAETPQGKDFKTVGRNGAVSPDKTFPPPLAATSRTPLEANKVISSKAEDVEALATKDFRPKNGVPREVNYANLESMNHDLLGRNNAIVLKPKNDHSETNEVISLETKKTSLPQTKESRLLNMKGASLLARNRAETKHSVSVKRKPASSANQEEARPGSINLVNLLSTIISMVFPPRQSVTQHLINREQTSTSRSERTKEERPKLESEHRSSNRPLRKTLRRNETDRFKSKMTEVTRNQPDGVSLSHPENPASEKTQLTQSGPRIGQSKDGMETKRGGGLQTRKPLSSSDSLFSRQGGPGDQPHGVERGPTKRIDPPTWYPLTARLRVSFAKPGWQ